LLRVVGMKNNSRVNLKINEPVGGLRSENPAGDTSSAMPVMKSAERASKSVDEAMADLKI